MPGKTDTINQGGTLSICTTAQTGDLNQAAMAALTYVNIGRIVTFPTIGFEVNFVTQDYVNTTVSQDQKGIRSGSSSEIVVGSDQTDAGQTALHTASLSNSKYAFKRVYANGITTYFMALVGNAVDSGGGVEDFENYTFPIKITGQLPIKVDAT